MILTVMTGDPPNGYVIELTRKQRYEFADMVLDPEGSGFARTSGRAARFDMDEGARLKREAAIREAEEEAARGEATDQGL